MLILLWGSFGGLRGWSLVVRIVPCLSSSTCSDGTGDPYPVAFYLNCWCIGYRARLGSLRVSGGHYLGSPRDCYSGVCSGSWCPRDDGAELMLWGSRYVLAMDICGADGAFRVHAYVFFWHV